MEYIEEMLSLSEDEIYRRILETIAPDFPRAFDKSTRILCIAPHPDDCEFGVGGTIARYSSMGKEIYFAILTDGSKGTTDRSISPDDLAAIRRREEEDACRVLGVRRMLWLGYRDGELEYSLDLVYRLISIIRIVRPEIVLAPDPTLRYEFHPDHIAAGRAAGTAAMFSHLPHYNHIDLEKGLEPHRIEYIGFYYTPKPNIYIDITGYFDKKLEALRRHRSQFEENWDQFSRLLYLEARLYGKKIGKQYAEAIRLMPTQLLHVYHFSEHI